MKNKLAYICFVINSIGIPLASLMIWTGYNIILNIFLIIMVLPGYYLACIEIFTYKRKNIPETQKLYCFECEMEMLINFNQGILSCANCGLKHYSN